MIYYKDKIIEKEQLKEEIAKEQFACMGLYINNRIVRLNSEIKDGDKISPILLNSSDGQKIYKKTCLFLICAAFHKLYPQYTLECFHSIYRGEFIKVSPNTLTKEELKNVVKLIKTWIKNDVKIEKVNKTQNNISKVLEIQNFEYSLPYQNYDIYKIDDYYDFATELITVSCKNVSKFKVSIEKNGILLLIPKKENPNVMQTQKNHGKLMTVFDQMKDWVKIHGVGYVGDLNRKITNNDYEDVIRISEILQENRFDKAAQCALRKNAKIIFLTGPSSSGKTTCAHRLRIQLMVHEANPIVISMDDYFLPRKEMVPDEDGTIDFEKIECLDLKKMREQITLLSQGEPVNMRKFDFVSGEPYYEEKTTTLPKNGILIIEGIHALNPKVINLFKGINVYKVAVNPLTLLNIDNHNRFSSTDVRKIRRIVRDVRTRGFSAERTLSMWSSIRKGEEKNIFPYLENCNIMINTTLVYELSALKKMALKALREIPQDSECATEANRLIDVLEKVKSLPSDKIIPENSILREFIGF